jgi:putative hydrolase of the HAD superfamily
MGAGPTSEGQRLALFDLDNTLIDREAAFRSWASRFARERRLGRAASGWLESIDDDGVKPRETFFGEVRGHFGIPDAVDELVRAYRAAIPALIPPPTRETKEALRALRACGWRIGIVTNGSPTQEVHLRGCGLEELVDGYVVSSIVGVRKPDPRLFLAAAEQCGAPLSGGWMVGDRADADVAGALACGISSAWISRGRTWEEADFRPDIIADSVAGAVTAILDER